MGAIELHFHFLNFKSTSFDVGVAWGYGPALSHMTETEKQGFKVAFILACNDRRALARGALKPQYLEKSDQKDKGARNQNRLRHKFLEDTLKHLLGAKER